MSALGVSFPFLVLAPFGLWLPHGRRIYSYLNCHNRLVVVYPLTALVNLFIHILQNPQSPSIDSDIGLMYLIAGHFSYVEYAVAGRVFPSIGHMANLARLTVNNARSRSGVGGGGLAMDDNNELCSGTEVTLDHHDQPLQQQQQLDLESFEDVSIDGLFLPSIPQLFLSPLPCHTFGSVS